MVEQALDLLVPDLGVDADALLSAARARAGRLSAARRRRQTASVLAFALLLLFAGAAIAAHKLDLFSFLHTTDRNSARFSVSRSLMYRGAVAPALTCPDARTGTFVCRETSPLAAGRRTYELGKRATRIPLLTRRSMLALITHLHTHVGEQVEKDQMRADLAKSGNDFIRALATLAQIDTAGVGQYTSLLSGAERVPPIGVPAWAACRAITPVAFRCRPLPTLEGIARRTPLYYLKPSPDWRTVSAPSAGNPNVFLRQLERLLGRKPTAAELHLVYDFVALGQTWDHSNLPSLGLCQRCVVMTVTQNLGVRARVLRGSGYELPLPHGPLPGGLKRSKTFLYIVGFDVLRPHGQRAGHHWLLVYIQYSPKLRLYQVVWITRKP
jgi:hypothetical protein